jgi:hypothetical protein
VTGTLALLFDLEQKRVTITVDVRLAYELAITTRITLSPQFFATSAPIDHPALTQSHRQAFGVHPRHHQDVTSGNVLSYGRNQTITVESDLIGIGE